MDIDTSILEVLRAASTEADDTEFEDGECHIDLESLIDELESLSKSIMTCDDQDRGELQAQLRLLEEAIMLTQAMQMEHCPTRELATSSC